MSNSSLLTIWREECLRAPALYAAGMKHKELRFDEPALVRIGSAIEASVATSPLSLITVPSDLDILRMTTEKFPRWREDIQEAFVLAVANGTLELLRARNELPSARSSTTSPGWTCRRDSGPRCEKHCGLTMCAAHAPSGERVNRLIAAIEGECHGLCISEATAREILDYLDTGLPPYMRAIASAAMARDESTPTVAECIAQLDVWNGHLEAAIDRQALEQLGQHPNDEPFVIDGGSKAFIGGRDEQGDAR